MTSAARLIQTQLANALSADCNPLHCTSLHDNMLSHCGLLDLQPLDISALIKGKEPLLKLQLTHTTDGGCVLAATMPHLLAGAYGVQQNGQH